MTGLTVTSTPSSMDLWGQTSEDLQSDVAIADGAITGTLTKQTSGALVDRWGAGYFLALTMTNVDSDALYVMAGLEPSEGSGLVKLDADNTIVCKITDKSTQKFKVVQYTQYSATVQMFDLSGLTLAE